MKEFPKMLYKTHSDHITVDTGKEEASARADGYVNFVELSESKPEVSAGKYANLAEEISDLNDQIQRANTANAERIAGLEQTNSILSAQKTELEQKLQAQADSHAVEVSDLNLRLHEANKVNQDNTQFVDQLTAELDAANARIKELEDAKAQAAVDVTQANTDPTGSTAGKAGATTKVNK